MQSVKQEEIPEFQKSSYTDEQCVEVASNCHCSNGSSIVLVRDSKDISKSPVQFSASTWSTFLNELR